MTERQHSIVRQLEELKANKAYAPSAYDLAWKYSVNNGWEHYPEPSVRRDIGALRAQGYKITNNGNGYRLAK